MARKRMIDPSIWDSEQVQQLTATQFKLYVYLISAADDEGRFKVNYRMIASKAFPLEDNYQASECENDMRELYGDKLIRLYDTEEGLCGDHPNWTRYQAIQKPRPSSIPTFEQGTPLQYDYSTTTVALQPNRIERNRKEENTRAATPEPDGSLMENLPQPSKPKGELKDEDAALWEDALTSKQPSSTWGNYGKERQSCGSLAKRSRELLSQTPYTDMRELVGAVLSEYDRLKRSERTSWWRTAAWTPSQVLARWSAVWDSLAKESEKSRMWEEATS